MLLLSVAQRAWRMALSIFSLYAMLCTLSIFTHTPQPVESLKVEPGGGIESNLSGNGTDEILMVDQDLSKAGKQQV